MSLILLEKTKKGFKNFFERYQDLSQKEENKKQEHGREQYKNLSKDEKQRLIEYRKKYYKVWKNKMASQIKSD